MSRSLFWLSDEAWLAIEPHLPKNLSVVRTFGATRGVN